MNVETKGSSSFQEQDKEIFKGRKSETEALLNLVLYNDFSTLYAASGEGKSSLINAGLIPNLREKGYFPIVIKYNEEDYQQIKGSLLKEQKKGTSSNVFDDILVAKITGEADLKGYEYRKKYKDENVFAWLTDDHLFSSCNHWSDDHLTPILIFDQFEEIFTQGWTREFWEWLYNLYTKLITFDTTKSCLKVLLSLRSDYICELDYWSIQREEFYIPQLKHNRYYLKPLTISGSKEIIEQYNLPTGITTDEIIEYSKSPSALGNLAKVDNEPYVYALALMMILTEIKNNAEGLKRIISKSANKNIIDSLIESHYESVLSKIGLDSRSNAREVFESVLTNENGKKIRININNKYLQRIQFERKFLKSLVDERIITKSSTDGGNTTWIEFSHDSLLRIASRHHNNRQENKTRNSLCALALILSVGSLFYGLHDKTGITEEWVSTIDLFWKSKMIDIWPSAIFPMIDTIFLLYAIVVFPQAIILLTTKYKKKSKALCVFFFISVFFFVARFICEQFYGNVPTPNGNLLSYWSNVWLFYLITVVSQILVSLFSYYNISTNAQTNDESILSNLSSTSFSKVLTFINYTIAIVLAANHYFFDCIPLIFFSPLVLFGIVLLYRCLDESRKLRNYVSIICLLAVIFICKLSSINNELYLLITVCILILLSLLSVKKYFIGCKNARKNSAIFSVGSILLTVYSIGYNPIAVSGTVITEISQPWEYVVVKQKGYDKNTVDILHPNGDEILHKLNFDSCSTNFSTTCLYKSWKTNTQNQYYDTILKQPNYPLYYEKSQDRFTIYVVPALEFIIKDKLNKKGTKGTDYLQAAIFIKARKLIVDNIYQNNRVSADNQLKNLFESLLSRQLQIYQNYIEECKKMERKSSYLTSKVKDIRKSLACYLSTLQLYEAFFSKEIYSDDDLKQQMIALQLYTSLQIITKDAKHFKQFVNVYLTLSGEGNKSEKFVAKFQLNDWLNDEVGSAINWIYTYDVIYHHPDMKYNRWLDQLKQKYVISQALHEKLLKEALQLNHQNLTNMLENLIEPKKETETIDFTKLDSIRNELHNAVNFELLSKNYTSPIFSNNAIKDILSLTDTQTPDYNTVFIDLSKMLIVMGLLRDIDMHVPFDELNNAINNCNYGQIYQIAKMQDSILHMYNQYIEESNRNLNSLDSLTNQFKRNSYTIDSLQNQLK